MTDNGFDMDVVKLALQTCVSNSSVSHEKSYWQKHLMWLRPNPEPDIFSLIDTICQLLHVMKYLK